MDAFGPSMPANDDAAAKALGPVRWVQLPHPPGVAAEPLALRWLEHAMGVGEGQLVARRDQHGRPRLQATARPAHDASWSHSGDQLLVALGQEVAVGADLERLRARPRALELANRFFHADESAWLQARPQARRDVDFVRLWCAKEAILKAHGRGIAFGLHRFRVGDVDGALQLVAADPALGVVRDWSLHEFEPAPGYRAALAWRRVPTIG